MTTWGELLADIQVDISDDKASPRHSERVLYLYTKFAIRDYSRHFPIRTDRTELTLSGDAYPLPSNFIRAIHVESPKYTFLEEAKGRPGRRAPQHGRLLTYFLSGGNLYLNGTPATGNGVFLTYMGSHSVPASETDTAFVLTIPDADLELIMLFVHAKVAAKTRARQANLDRFKMSAGKRDDNPLEPEVQEIWEEYYRKLADRYGGGVIALYRPGRTR